MAPRTRAAHAERWFCCAEVFPRFFLCRYPRQRISEPTRVLIAGWSKENVLRPLSCAATCTMATHHHFSYCIL